MCLYNTTTCNITTTILLHSSTPTPPLTFSTSTTLFPPSITTPTANTTPTITPGGGTDNSANNIAIIGIAVGALVTIGIAIARSHYLHRCICRNRNCNRNHKLENGDRFGGGER